jgi:FADH2 O2-dependent halogenase
MTYDWEKQFDVILLGSGLGGSILATILARQNVRVLMIDKEVHPRFAIGEATTPDMDLMMVVLSYMYSVPEIAHLSSFNNICNNISPSACGIKRSFNFVYHREMEGQTLEESNKIGVRDSSHFFRQDIDHYMVKVAINYGVKLLENIKVVDINTDSTKVEVIIEGGEKFTANFLVDGSGYNSLLSQKFNLREEPTRLKTHSRSIFTHMVQVKRYDDCFPANIANLERETSEILWHEGTLHHIFDGGWMWVIPFNNHAASKNPICSVGLNFNLKRFPKTDISPEQEFQDFLSRYPSIAVQFEDAKPVRKWVSTGRLQYSSRTCMGNRFYLLPHATGFIDPLFSFGLANTCTVLIPLASKLLTAISKNDYSTANFASVERLQQKLIDYNDRIVNGSYISFTNFNLWNVWRRIWLMGTFTKLSKILLSVVKGEKLHALNENEDFNGLTYGYEGLSDTFFKNAFATIEKVEEGSLSPEDAVSQLLALINSIDFLPTNFMAFGDPLHKNANMISEFAVSERQRFFSWVKTSTKLEVRKYFDSETKDFSSASDIAEKFIQGIYDKEFVPANW